MIRSFFYAARRWAAGVLSTGETPQPWHGVFIIDDVRDAQVAQWHGCICLCQPINAAGIQICNTE